MASIKFSSIPDSNFTIEEGRYPLVCIEAKLTKSSGGFKMIELTWEHLGNPKFKIKFDNYIYGTATEDFDMENAGCRFGLQKLKALNEATVNIDSLDPNIFTKVIVGKKVEADVILKENNKGIKNPEINNKSFYKLTETTATPETTISFDLTGEEDPFSSI